MLLMTPCEINGERAWRQTRVLGFERGHTIVGRMGRLLSLIGSAEAAKLLAARAGSRCHLSPGQSPLDLAPELWTEDASLSEPVAEAAWREEAMRRHRRQMEPASDPLGVGGGERAIEELRWFWSERLSRWESPVFFLTSSGRSPVAWLSEMRVIATASMLWSWDQDALRLSEGWPRELSEADFFNFATGMSAEGMRLCQKESFHESPVSKNPAVAARWLSALEAKELEESSARGAGSGESLSLCKRL